MRSQIEGLSLPMQNYCRDLYCLMKEETRIIENVLKWLFAWVWESDMWIRVMNERYIAFLKVDCVQCSRYSTRVLEQIPKSERVILPRRSVYLKLKLKWELSVKREGVEWLSAECMFIRSALLIRSCCSAHSFVVRCALCWSRPAAFRSLPRLHWNQLFTCFIVIPPAYTQMETYQM